MLGQLLKMHYLLGWARLRSTASRVTILLMALALLAVNAGMLLLGGSTGSLARQLERGPEFAEALLAGLFLNGLVATAFLGLGGRTRLSDRRLRQYPLGIPGRFVAVHLLGVLGPLWVLLTLLAVGFTVRLLQPAGPRLAVGLAVVAAFVVLSHLAVDATLACLELALRALARGRWVAALALGLVPLAITFAFVATRLPWPADARLGSLAQVWAAPAVGARLLVGPAGWSDATGALVLLALGASLVAVLRGIDLWEPPPAEKSSGVHWPASIDRWCGWMGAEWGALFAKALLYDVRCMRVRVSVLVSLPLLAGASSVMPAVLPPELRAVAPEPFVLTLALFCIGGLIATQGVSVNLLGFEGPGLKRHLFLPVPLASVLAAASAAALFVGSAVSALAFLAWLAFAPDRQVAGVPALLVLAALAGLLLFNGLGLWSSVLTPVKGDMRSALQTTLSPGAYAVLLAAGATLVALVVAGTRGFPRRLLDHPGAALVVLVVALFLYALSLRWTGALLERRRERFLHGLST